MNSCINLIVSRTIVFHRAAASADTCNHCDNTTEGIHCDNTTEGIHCDNTTEGIHCAR